MVVVDFAQKKLESSPHKTGEVKCVACKHTWIAVVPADAADGFECPNCNTMRGMWNYGFDIEAGDASFRCMNCEYDGFIIAVKPSGHNYIVCKSCGTIDRPPMTLLK
jgi:DNA-directed RNA polymerase subunit RPC12/RpoP